MITEADVKRIADEAAKKAVDNLMMRLGVDSSDADDVGDFRKDLAHLRTWRLASGIVGVSMLRTAVGVIVTGFLGAIYLMFFKQP